MTGHVKKRAGTPENRYLFFFFFLIFNGSWLYLQFVMFHTIYVNNAVAADKPLSNIVDFFRLCWYALDDLFCLLKTVRLVYIAFGVLSDFHDESFRRKFRPLQWKIIVLYDKKIDILYGKRCAIYKSFISKYRQQTEDLSFSVFVSSSILL